jgi:osmotically-inducible protein OsmY
MKIAAFMVLAGLVGCSRSDKTATVEPVGTVTVTSADLTPPAAAIGEQDELDRRVILAAARNLPAVIDVVGGMNASATHEPTGDEQATVDVQLALLDDDAFTGDAKDATDIIDVRVDNGIATIRGNATTPEARTQAERIALRHRGVVSVDNQVRVRPAATRSAPAHR